ncbi:MAG: 4'-phosphopantetheinyl transferase family protein [Burkholderiaceae bacterium]
MLALDKQLAGQDLRIWGFTLAFPLDTATSAFLSSDIVQRSQRFVFERDQQRHQAAHAHMRRLLCTHFGLGPSDCMFDEGKHGKPQLAGDHAALAFNLSHSADMGALCVASSGHVGIDIEHAHPLADIDALVRANFTPSEQQEYAHQRTDSARHTAFFTGWTRKEACLKALGTGLSLEAQAVDAGLAPGRRSVAVHWQGRAVTVEVDSFQPGPGLIGAVACVADRDFAL